MYRHRTLAALLLSAATIGLGAGVGTVSAAPTSPQERLDAAYKAMGLTNAVKTLRWDSTTRLLEERGVKVTGVARARHVHEEPSGEPIALAEHVSVPLGDAVKLINKISQNLHTEMLLRTVARQSGVWATPDELMKIPADFYATAGIAPGEVIQSDASGLSRHDLVTPRAIATLLSFAQKQSWFGTYYASLPVAGVDGTLEDRMKNTLAAGQIHAKTGSVEHVRTLSGFAETAGGRRVIFSFLSNNQGGKSHEAADALTGLCVAMLEEFNVTPPKRGLEHKHLQ